LATPKIPCDKLEIYTPQRPNVVRSRDYTMCHAGLWRAVSGCATGQSCLGDVGSGVLPSEFTQTEIGQLDCAIVPKIISLLKDQKVLWLNVGMSPIPPVSVGSIDGFAIRPEGRLIFVDIVNSKRNATALLKKPRHVRITKRVLGVPKPI
jgi:hypothetical protein